MKDRRVHYRTQWPHDTLCRETRGNSATYSADRVTCLRCMFLMGRYFPIGTTPERRAQLLERVKLFVRA